MVIPGFCESCRKIKNVRVNSAGMVRLAQHGTATGTCTACEEQAQQERRGGRRHGR